MKIRSGSAVTALVVGALLATNAWTYARMRRAEARVEKLQLGARNLESRIEDLLAEPRTTPPAVSTPATPPPAFEAPPSEQEAAPVEPDPSSLEEDYLPPQEIRRILDEAMDEHFRDLALSDEERRVLADAVYAFREAQAGLRQITYSPEHAEQFRRLQEQREASWRTFEAITNMTPAEFMRRADPGGGITHEDADTGPIVFEYLEEPQP